VKAKEKPAFALEDTLAVFGIRKNPFPIDETDDLFFSTPTLTKQIDLLRNLVEYSDLLLVVSGVEGAGKTTFLDQFLLVTDRHWKCCRIDARTAMTLDALVDELLDGFGLKARGEDARGDEALLHAYLADLRANDDVPLVTVDDAHLLPQICTEFLLGLAREREHSELRLLLCAEPGRLGFPTNDPKHVHVVVLQPFDEQQSGDYIHTRLSYGGLGGDSPFSASVIDDIHQDSGGLPGAIHSLALHTLMANTDISRLASSPSVFGLVQGRPLRFRRPMLYLAAALLIGGGAVIFLRPGPGLETVASMDTETTGKLRGRVTGVTVQATTGEPSTPAGDRQGAGGAQPGAVPFAGSVTAKAPAREPQAATPGVVRAHAGSDAKVFTLGESGTSARPAVAVSAATPGKDPASGKDTGQVVRLAGNVTAAASSPAKAQAGRDLDWLRKQDPSHYVIQLVGTRDAAAAGKFLEDHKLGSQGAWFVTSHESKPWYIVVYGTYPDNSSARTAINALPETLRARSPWPRSVASVIKNAR
jgi:DamX protein